MKLILVIAAGVLLAAPSYGQDANELEARYKTCAKHFIPSDQCTQNIYQQLLAKDNAPLDPQTEQALKAVKEYRSRLKNPDSMILSKVYLTNDGAICLEVGAQNGMGGVSVSRVVFLTDSYPHRGRGKWMDEGGFGGSASADSERQLGSGLQVNRWPGFCTKARFAGEGPIKVGVDLTDKVNQALKR
jgi:hypothetical protein